MTDTTSTVAPSTTETTATTVAPPMTDTTSTVAPTTTETTTSTVAPTTTETTTSTGAPPTAVPSTSAAPGSPGSMPAWQLALVIGGSVLGALLLILLMLVACKVSKKKSKTNCTEFVGKPYVNDSAPKAPLVNGHSVNSQASVSDKGSVSGLAAFSKVEVLKIPRAKFHNPWNSSNSVEMTASNSRQNPFPAGRNSWLNNNYDSSNTSTQARSQNNPNDQSGGYNNPYYTYDNEN
ncbi:cell wall protein TIR4-like [Mugil cephalus]|uniref:cell wall protein TIR4-like n=1 Tax=Mugil cephalus TaxID=48193 RepID=UPI001FB738A6|nr:cell wall protein TIR4-like [Mugil cephalus]